MHSEKPANNVSRRPLQTTSLKISTVLIPTLPRVNCRTEGLHIKSKALFPDSVWLERVYVVGQILPILSKPRSTAQPTIFLEPNS
jgi:hypothetical protein